MYSNGKIWIGQSDNPIYMQPKMLNRHGLIAGATGTGKTVTLKVMAESLSDLGVPVFLSDVKGDLSGTCEAGIENDNVKSRVARFGIENFEYKKYPCRFWDIFGEQGHPVRVTISDMGPVLLSRLLKLTDVQAGVLNIVFKIADEHGLLLLDLKDLRAMLQFVGDNREEFTTTYGNVSTASIGAIQRALLTIENEGGEIFFGEPSLDITDWIRTDTNGRGYINILNSTKLIQSPLIYSTFLLWMLTELYEQLPEVGDLDKPRMVFFFDEAHLLFNDAEKSLMQKLVQIVKLIRSKGVGIYFISQSPSDIPDEVLAQLSNRIQHALRAYTPAEQKALRATASAFRVNPAFDTQTVLMELGVGEALISCLDEQGIPTMVERAFILPPQSKMGPADPGTVKAIVVSDEFDLKYRNMIDRESAYEILLEATEELERQRQLEAEEVAAEKQRQKDEAAAEKQRQKDEATAEKQRQRDALALQREQQKQMEAYQKQILKEQQAQQKAYQKELEAQQKAEQKRIDQQNKMWERAATSAANSVARSVSTNMVNTVMGGRKASGTTIAKRAASSALSSVMRSGSTSIVRGLFGNKR